MPKLSQCLNAPCRTAAKHSKLMTTVGTFTIIRNEIAWIVAHLESWLPHVDEAVFYDGNSTDGTLEVLKQYGGKVKVFENKDPQNLQDDYVKIFDQCLHELSTDYAIFAHPDMILMDPGNIRNLGENLSYFSNMLSFAGEPGGKLYQISGRSQKWKNVYRLRNPDLGLHYWGHYGAQNEDCYFKEITGDEHAFHGNKFEKYPYAVGDSGIKINHYSDVRTKERRLDRMVKCLLNQGYLEEDAKRLAPLHPRVTLEPGLGFDFAPAEYPGVFRVPA